VAAEYRQEVLNVVLAQLLEERGLISPPESIIKLATVGQRRVPDVIVSFQGLRTAIEGEVSDQPHAQTRALQSARKRVEEGIAHIGVAVVYPEVLRKPTFARLKSELGASALEIAIVTESHETGFASGSIDYLENALRSAFDRLVQEDVVAHAVAALDAGIERFASTIVAKDGIMGKLAETLGIGEPVEEDLSVEGE